jgi:peptidoglycan hydrolase-like protein with peptidoglycan-binding domain
VVRIVQQNLRDLGMFSGRADGIAGPGTVRAVRDYVDSLKQQG